MVPVSKPAQTVAYFDSSYQEALALAREARNFIVYRDSAEAARLDPAARLVISCETMRVTARIGQVIAWLLVQKAVHAGELSREQAAQAPHRLGGQKACAVDEPVADEKIPPRLTDLLARSHSLYTRVQRLDAALDNSEPD